MLVCGLWLWLRVNGVESAADGVAYLVAFHVDSLNVEGKAGGKGIEDGSRRNGFNVGTDGCKSRA